MTDRLEELRGGINPILTNLAIEYNSDQFVADIVCPTIQIPKSVSTVIEFDKSDFLKQNSKRGIGADAMRVDIGSSTQTINRYNHSLDSAIDKQEINEAIPIINLQARKLTNIMQRMYREIEYDVITALTTSTNFNSTKTLNGTANKYYWDDDTNGDPKANIETGKETIRSAIGRDPNVLLLSPTSYKNLKNNATVTSNFTYTGTGNRGNVVTLDILQEYLEIPRIVVCKETYVTDPDATSFTDIMGDYAVLLYVAPQPARDVPSFAYRAVDGNGGLQGISYSEMRSRSVIVGVDASYGVNVVCKYAGYLISTTTDPS